MFVSHVLKAHSRLNVVLSVLARDNTIRAYILQVFSNRVRIAIETQSLFSTCTSQTKKMFIEKIKSFCVSLEYSFEFMLYILLNIE